jgi:hypothetical protein
MVQGLCMDRSYWEFSPLSHHTVVENLHNQEENLSEQQVKGVQDSLNIASSVTRYWRTFGAGSNRPNKRL